MKLNNKTKIILALVALVLFVITIYLINFQVQKLFFPRKYKEYVESYSSIYSVPEYVVYSVIKVESNFKADAVSQAGACGLMQLMPSTYSWLVSMANEKEGDIFSEEENIKYGTYLLSILYEKYNNWTLTYCAYNAGMGNVDSWLENEPFRIEFLETKHYVNKIEVVQDKYISLYYR